MKGSKQCSEACLNESDIYLIDLDVNHFLGAARWLAVLIFVDAPVLPCYFGACWFGSSPQPCA